MVLSKHSFPPAWLVAATILAVTSGATAQAQSSGGAQSVAPLVAPLIDERIAAPDALHAVMQYAVLPPLSGSPDLARLPGHRHEGHLLVYVLEGEVHSSLDDGPAVRYAAGAAWFERPGQLHRILNLSRTGRARLLVVTLEPVAAGRTD